MCSTPVRTAAGLFRCSIGFRVCLCMWGGDQGGRRLALLQSQAVGRFLARFLCVSEAVLQAKRVVFSWFGVVETGWFPSTKQRRQQSQRANEKL